MANTLIETENDGHWAVEMIGKRMTRQEYLEHSALFGLITRMIEQNGVVRRGHLPNLCLQAQEIGAKVEADMIAKATGLL